MFNEINMQGAKKIQPLILFSDKNKQNCMIYSTRSKIRLLNKKT